MYQVLKLYAIHRSRIDTYDPGDCSPQQFQSLAGMETLLYILIKPNNGVRRFGIAYGRLITDHTIGLYPSWEEFADHISLEFILGYSESIPGYGSSPDHPDNPLVIWDVMHADKVFDTIYADADTEYAGIYAFRHQLHDLRFKLQPKTDVTKPNLSKCIPVVNGFTCYPIWKEDALYALDGSRLCYNTDPHLIPEILLLDFQYLGDMSVHPLYIDKFPERSFSVGFANRTGKFTLNADWVLTSQYSLYEYTPIIVLAGVLIFPDKIEIISEHSFRVKVHDIPFNKSLIMRSFYMIRTNSVSDVSYDTEDISDFLQFELTQETFNPSKNTFVILVKTPRLYVNRQGTDTWRNGITVDIYTEEGLLVHDATQCILGYHCAPLTNKKELTVQNTHQFYMADHLFPQKQLGFIQPDCRHNEFQDLFQGNSTIVSVMGG